MQLVAIHEVILDNPRGKGARIAVQPGYAFNVDDALGGTLRNSGAARLPKEDEPLKFDPNFSADGSEQEPSKPLEKMNKAELLAEVERRQLTLPEDADTNAKIVEFLKGADEDSMV